MATTATSGKSNLSFVLNGANDVAFVDRPVPAIADPHDVLLAINYTGICGSDLHYWSHGRVGPYVVTKPMVLGHESAGTVVEVGAAVTTLRPGDRVAIEPGYPCRRCSRCLGGNYNLCGRMEFAATPPVHGTLTGFWVAPDDFCHRLPDSVSLQEGALAEPLAVAVHACRLAEVGPGRSVAVVGAGPVGLLCAATARAFGASTVVCVDVSLMRLEFAREFAATHVYRPGSNLSSEGNARALIEAAGLGSDDGGGGADVVIEASGTESGIQMAVHAISPGGNYVQVGLGQDSVVFPISALCAKEATARGCFRYRGGDYALAVELMATGRVRAADLISVTLPFSQAEEAFRIGRDGGAIKVMIAGPNEAAPA